LHILGMVVVLFGVVFVATPLGSALEQKRSLHMRGLPRGVVWAILASLGYGISFWMLGFYVTPQLGAITATWLSRLLTPLVLVACAPLVRQSLSLPRGNVWWYIVGIGIVDTMAFVAYNFGLEIGPVSVVSVVSSLYSAVTVLLAWIVLREQLQRSQWLGVGVVFAGIAMVNI